MNRAFVFLCIAAAFSIVVWSSPAIAAFSQSHAATGTRIAAATLMAPQNPNTTTNANLINCSVSLSWNNPQPAIVSKWSVQRYIGLNADGPMRTVTVTSITDNLGLSLLTSYTWRIRAVVGSNWQGPEASSSHFITSLCL